jgi:hypothetical protein
MLILFIELINILIYDFCLGKKNALQADNAKSSRAISMSSAVCSLVVLSSDEHYFLGSSMDGSVSA